MRHAPGGRDPMLVLLNYGAEPAEVEVPAALRQELGPGPLVDVLGGEVVGPDVAFLAGYGVRIIRRSGAVSPPA
jgi:hypothetical protein